MFSSESVTDIRIWSPTSISASTSTSTSTRMNTDLNINSNFYIPSPEEIEKNTLKFIEKLHAISFQSSMITSSRDKKLILWKFELNSVTDSQIKNIENSVLQEFPYFLKPIPCRKFCFSDFPSHGICFPSNIVRYNEELKIDANSNSKNKIKSNQETWQINTIIQGRVMTVFKNTKNELFQIESEFNDLNLNNSNFTAKNDITTNDIISKQQTENKNENVENEILHFTPVIVPLKNVQKSVTLHSKKLNPNHGLSLNVLHAWAVSSDTGELKERLAARGQSTDIFKMIS